MTGSIEPNKRIFRIVRRIMRRKTYPRPSLPGVTPSPISMADVRAWSAITRKETSDFSDEPYFTPVNSEARFRILMVVSIS